MDKKIIKKGGRYFTETERHFVIKELLSSQCTKAAIWEKYTGMRHGDHGQLLRWMRALGYDTSIKSEKPDIVSNSYPMTRNRKPDKSQSEPDESFENLQLKKRIAELEKQLKDAEMKAIAFSTMVTIAEKEFKIPIRKKLNTKP